MMKRLTVVMLAILIGIMLSACAAPPAPSEVPTPPPPPAEETAPPVEPAPEPTPPVTFEPIVITGSGDKTSPPFTITTDEWDIDWSFVPNPEYPEMAIFGFFVYPRGETVLSVESIMSGMGGETSGSTYSYAGASEYYIQVIAANIKSWEIVISPP